MTNPNKVTESVQTPEMRPSRPRLSPTERRAAHFAEIADQQANLKREAAERRAAREAKANSTN